MTVSVDHRLSDEKREQYLDPIDRQLDEMRRVYVRIERPAGDATAIHKRGGHLDTAVVVGLYAKGPTNPKYPDWFPPCPVYFIGAPGTAKTAMMTSFLPPTMGVEASRIQCMPEMTKEDVLGSEFARRVKTDEGEEIVLMLRLGPIFSPLVAVDEHPRKPPPLDAVFLEALSEPSVSLPTMGDYREGRLVARASDMQELEEATTFSQNLPPGFFPTFSANEIESEGVYPVGEAFWDRMGMVVVTQRPTIDEKAAIFRAHEHYHEITVNQVTTVERVMDTRRFIRDTITIPDDVLQYAARLTQAIIAFPAVPSGVERLWRDTQDQEWMDFYHDLWRDPDFLQSRQLRRARALGDLVEGGGFVGTRGHIFLCETAKVMALLRGRTVVYREDVQKLFPRVMHKRFLLTGVGRAAARELGGQDALREIILERILERLEAY